jgi:hypothetical protein
MSMKDSNGFSRKLGMIGAGLCLASCLLPIAAVTFGVGALAAISAYITWFGIITLVFAVVTFGIYYYRRRQPPTCDVDCGCKKDSKISEKPQ